MAQVNRSDRDLTMVVRACVVGVLSILALVALSSCGGGSSDTGAGELARQHELSAARRQAAQDARQATRINELEHELHKVAHEKGEAHSTAIGTGDSSQPADEPAPEAIGSTDWPGGSGFTAVLASVSSEAEARSIETEATGRGLDAGVLFSSDYSSLRPGYWVVFSGVYPNAEGAETRASRAHELGYSDAYPRFVAP
jgi:hypothetical protein